MRRRTPEESAGLPSQLAEFDVADWWVVDVEDPIEVQYARIRWGVARRAYLAGEDWQACLRPPPWWDLLDPKPQTRSRGQLVHDPDP